MLRMISIALVGFVIFSLFAHVVRAEKKEERISLIEYIVSLVPCNNPEEVATIVFGGTSVDKEGFGYIKLHTEFEEIDDIGDGQKAYIFSPPGGSGSWAYLPNYHFIKRQENMILMFDGEGKFSEYVTWKPKINGRYEIHQTYRADSFGGFHHQDVEIASGNRLWFWNGNQYLLAYTDIMIDQANDPSIVGNVIRTWNLQAKHLYQHAHRTWSHKVGAFETLSRLCLQAEINMQEVMKQNNLHNPDKIYEGQTLTYDSSLKK